MNEIKNKLYNIELVIEDIKKSPQTYETILKELKNDGTAQVILRRKLNIQIKLGTICKTAINCTRFGKAIFYVLPKNYFILIEASRLGSNVYYFKDYKKDGKYHIKVNEVYELQKSQWIKIAPRRFFEGDILNFI